MQILEEINYELNRTGINIKTDPVTKILYSTDASLYQIEPLGVAIPETHEQLSQIVEIASKYKVPILPRGSGSSLAGQAIGKCLIIDCSKHLDQIYEIHRGLDGEESYVWADPGVVINNLNRATQSYGLHLGPDPASSDRATIGGSIANNASGSHSIIYGLFADHLLETDVYLANGSQVNIREVSLATARRLAFNPELPGTNVIYSDIFKAALDIRNNKADLIKEKWPKTWRRVSGYNLNYLLPWSASSPPQWTSINEHNPTSFYPPIKPDHINLCSLLCGSEGTIAVVKRAKIRLVSKPRNSMVAVLSFNSVLEACEATSGLLQHNPSAIELLPRYILRLAKSVPAYAKQMGFIGDDPAAILIVEFTGNDADNLRDKCLSLRSDVRIAETNLQQKQVWDVRKVGLGIMQSKAGDLRTHTFIEDLSVPVENLGDFVRGMDQIADEFGTIIYYYAHASAGCLHLRPLLNLKTPHGVKKLREIAKEAVDLVISLGGATSGEHGDGLARSEWLEKLYGTEIVEAFRRIKTAADPHSILNPGKIIDHQPMDQNLRYDPSYTVNLWKTSLCFDHQNGLNGAIELCNGAGVCRKPQGVMCPSFQATREEIHSTRGRANLLRAFISGHQLEEGTHITAKDVLNALDLCLACKGCKSECPSAVDLAKLKYEFTNYYYKDHLRKPRDYLMGYFQIIARFGNPFGNLVNSLMDHNFLRIPLMSILGLAPQRRLPKYRRKVVNPYLSFKVEMPDQSEKQCLLLLDSYTKYFYPEVEMDAIRILKSMGYTPRVIPVDNAGRTLISKGFLEKSKILGNKLLKNIKILDPTGNLPIIGIEPSEIYTISDEYPDLFHDYPDIMNVANRAWMIDEFLIRLPDFRGKFQHPNLKQKPAVLLHGHCYQKSRPPSDDGSPTGLNATVTMLEASGFKVNVIESGCCGMAGSFGYEKEHYELSMRIGELALFPAIRKADENTYISASGVSCQSQIEDGTSRIAIHPISLVAMHLATP